MMRRIVLIMTAVSDLFVICFINCGGLKLVSYDCDQSVCVRTMPRVAGGIIDYDWKPALVHVRGPCAYNNFFVSHASVCCARSETSLPGSRALDWAGRPAPRVPRQIAWRIDVKVSAAALSPDEGEVRNPSYSAFRK